eukprot:TRINITY_DN313_c0_g1_i3.p1 TRINITY_DN313_c0_g1~~TRINITY_DN313_c0_g1_i3.p1  ORF type:complete len:147 (-),score=37.98 TRINITY_DN313_c0_g1_i3:176-616(-)
MKQYAHNACGTIGLIHSLVNIADEKVDAIKPDSWFAKFVERYRKVGDPVAIGKAFLGESELKEKHKQAVSVGQSNVSEEVETHFIAFINKDGQLIELDGGKSSPIPHGKTTEETFLTDTLKITKAFMERDPDELRFSTLVLAPSTI